MGLSVAFFQKYFHREENINAFKLWRVVLEMERKKQLILSFGYIFFEKRKFGLIFCSGDVEVERLYKVSSTALI